jgi:hypothetical protein
LETLEVIDETELETLDDEPANEDFDLEAISESPSEVRS